MSGKRRRPYAVRVTAGWSDTGKQQYKFISYHEDHADAMIALAEYNKSPYDMDAHRMTFADIAQRYDDSIEKSASDAVKKLNRTCFNHTKPLHKKIFRNLRKAHFADLIDDLDTPTAKSNVAMYFRKLSNFAMENDIIMKDYSNFVTVPRSNTAPKKIPFTVDEVETLWQNVGDVNAEIMLILCYTGMRVSELLNLRKDQINMAGRYIVAGSKTEAGRNRHIPLHSRIMPLVDKHMGNASKWLIVNSRGSQPIRYDSFHAKRWKKLKKRLAFRDELTIHSTRHFFISEMQRAGVKKIIVQKIVGHKGEDITDEVYTHIDNAALHEAVEKLK